MELNSQQLKYMLGSVEDFCGVFSYDQLPRNFGYPAAFIFNTDRHDQSGQHWMSAYFNKDGFGQYQCSLGIAPYGALYDFLSQHSYKTEYNKSTLQNPFNTACGYYCVLHILMANKGYELNDFVTLFDKEDLAKNDRLVLRLVAECLTH